MLDQHGSNSAITSNAQGFPPETAEDLAPVSLNVAIVDVPGVKVAIHPLRVRVAFYSVERAIESMAESREVMNIRQASQYLGVSPDTLYKYVYEEKIPAFKLGNRWRFKKSKLDQWMEEKSTMRESREKKKPKAAHVAAGGR